MANEIVATKKIEGVEKQATFVFDFGGNVDEAIKLFGADVVYANFVRSAVITAQAAMRRYLEDGLNNDEIVAKMQAWKPGVQMERVVDPVAATLSKFASMTPEEQAALISKLKSLKK